VPLGAEAVLEEDNMRTLVSIAMLVLVAGMAQAAEPTTATLACSGTFQTLGQVVRPQSMGLVVDFETGDVKGFDITNVYPKITAKDADKIYFGVTDDDAKKFGFYTNMQGVLDRITGDLTAYLMQRWPSEGRTTFQSWQLKCRPAPRMF
jgi:hypothetical protein